MRNGIFFATQATDFMGLMNQGSDALERPKAKTVFTARVAKPVQKSEQQIRDEVEFLDFCRGWNSKIADNSTLIF